ncbi:ABC transporter permease [Rhodococcus jostii]|uniref:ABC transporter permease n=1 Tax=Rhodococcus jostii TaxID=132919 RepID=UPI0009F5121D|nr:ABC transporter permease [Rhodococcus jostii]
MKEQQTPVTIRPSENPVTQISNAEAAPSVASRPTDRTRGFVERFALVGAWAVLIAVFSVLKPDTFPTADNFGTIFGSQAVLAVLALALIIPMTAGDYDLSVAFTLTLSAMITALLNVQHGWPIVPSMLLALLAGAAVGFVNGAIVTFFRIESIIVTLGTGTFIGGVVLWMSDSNTISGVAPGLVEWVIVKQLFGVPMGFYYALLLGAVMLYVFEFTPVGRRLLIVGRSRSVAKLSGINVTRSRIGSFVWAGLLSAVAGILYTGISGSADPSSGIQLLLPAFAAAFLGATTIMPGRFNPVGTLIAVYFLITGITGLQMLGSDSFVQNLFYGGALVLAVAISQVVRGRKAAWGVG